MVETKHSLKNFKIKSFVFLSAIGVWLFSLLLFKPWVIQFYSKYINAFDEGPRLFLKHTFIYSTPTALVCFLWIILLNKWKLIAPIFESFNRHIFLSGTIGGAIIVVVTLVLAPLLGFDYGFHFNPWSIAGNFTSNLGEEIIFRGLLFFSFWSALGSKSLAIVLSGVIFGFSHEQYPLMIKIYISGVGSVLSYLTSKHGSIIPAVIAHNIADWILDLFL